MKETNKTEQKKQGRPNHTKGHYGYLKARKRGLLIRGLILLVGIIILVVTGIIRFQTKNNLLTIVAVLTALPMAMQFATFFTILKYHSRPQEEYEKISQLVGNGLLNTELVVPSKTTKALEIAYLYVHSTGIYLYCENPKIPVNEAESYVKSFLKSNHVDGHVKIFTEINNFTKRLNELSPEDRETCDDLLLQQEGVLRAISM